ncbi:MULTISPECIES: respiratory chain complex I subunit 1 family protein [Thermodesulfovibrio]|uniref:Hydrogenase 4, component C or formate hydrogen lyase, subunit 4 n=2 Tax=Thermodesulfovibrio yellowstonii TaxID=28262 RepID=B5YKQ8_THEYD|nr:MULTISPECIES: NADH-quinone oxidoreductase subunit H [Thermodesulfovibrio]ACI20361.1 hydrogenase 4, component C or formate hydrogen lyase, subunit 4 [Thermodesulfovibrio yellowstonii DSM 11347]MDI6864236.1 NADH-quinone oxidoreductase subunit H [Thermodesulfovibrio yellowstonii]GLI53548.1 hydrogenase 4 component C or formate hydrogen lyase subunit 4 [Thermodesulfovibrio islandicus]
MNPEFVIFSSIVNILIVLILSPFFDGFTRKVRALIQSRIGPPPLQSYYDIIKLMGKEDLKSTINPLFRLSPYLSIISIGMASLLIPITELTPPLNFWGDIFLFIYIITVVGIAIIITASASENPFAYIGASRKMMLHLSVEPILAIALITGAINAGSFKIGDIVLWYYSNGPNVSMLLSTVCVFLSLQALIGKIPFDISEAEQEIAEGVLIELSGPKYACVKWANMSRQVLFCLVFTQIFVPWPFLENDLLNILIALVKVTAIIFISTLIEALNPRLRIDQALKYNLTLALFSLTSILLALLGV